LFNLYILTTASALYTCLIFLHSSSFQNSLVFLVYVVAYITKKLAVVTDGRPFLKYGD